MLEASLTSRIEALKYVFIAPGSTFSLTSLASALAVCVAFFVWRRRARGRAVRLRALVRYALPLRLFLHPSTRADAILFLLQTMVFGALLGWAYLSQPWIAGAVAQGLTFAFGEPGAAPIHPVAAAVIITLMSFLAYEFGYWLFHWAAHTHPLLWEFHKIHHTAEVLTPLTVWRVHPVEQVIFINTLAIAIGVCDGLGRYVLGGGAQIYALSGVNIVLVFFVYAFVHLQHSQAWIAFTGVWGRVFLSPAHHQIHHSANPIHHNTNLGSCLAVWDWAFGTLYMPARQREVESFGLGDDVRAPHDAVAALFDPVYRTVDYLTPPRLRHRPEVTSDEAPRPAPAGR
ncbi:MAG: sterol desaturase family protein [Beijerinckiaceae bacterium]|nr:sterol desaturase family protein [Beijerinckiaceae bacterium]